MREREREREKRYAAGCHFMAIQSECKLQKL